MLLLHGIWFKVKQSQSQRSALIISVVIHFKRNINFIFNQFTIGSVKELKKGELPGTEKADVTIPFELAMQVLEVLEASSICDMKPHEIPGSKMADVSIPSELATQVIKFL